MPSDAKTANADRMINVYGDHFDMGYLQGGMLFENIHAGWDATKQTIRENPLRPSYSPNMVFEYVASIYATYFLKETFSNFIEFKERFDGISHGAKIRPQKLAMLNFVEVIGADSPRMLMGCASVAVVPPRSDEPILAKNFDFVNEYAPFCVFRKSYIKLGKESMEFTMSALPGSHTGINAEGLSITYNYGFSAELPKRRPLLTAKIQHILHHCSTVAQAVRVLAKKPNPSPAIISIVDRYGNIAAVEISPDGVGIIKPKNGVIVNANLYDHPNMKQRMIPFDAQYGPKAPENIRGKPIQSTNIIRTERLRKLIATYEKLDLGTIKSILSDHGDDNQPSIDTICRHSEVASTHISIIMLPKSRRMLYCWGTPCTGKWEEATL